MEFKIGQVTFKIGIGQITVVAPILDHAYQITVLAPSGQRHGTEVQLFVDAHFKGSVEIKGDGIPF